MNDKEEYDSHRLKMLDAAKRAVQFLEKGQATGGFILLTNDDEAFMWDAHVTPTVHAIGDASLVLNEMGSRLRKVWYGLIAKGEDEGVLTVVDPE